MWWTEPRWHRSSDDWHHSRVNPDKRRCHRAPGLFWKYIYYTISPFVGSRENATRSNSLSEEHRRKLKTSIWCNERGDSIVQSRASNSSDEVAPNPFKRVEVCHLYLLNPCHNCKLTICPSRDAGISGQMGCFESFWGSKVSCRLLDPFDRVRAQSWWGLKPLHHWNRNPLNLRQNKVITDLPRNSNCVLFNFDIQDLAWYPKIC